MKRAELERLGNFSDSVRDSTLKRLRRVPPGRENDVPLDGMMSSADIATHIIDSDRALVDLADAGVSPAGLGVAGASVVTEREEYSRMIELLVDLRATRRDFILKQSDISLGTLVQFQWKDHSGQMDLGSMIYRVLDHEAHHRGALTVILRYLGAHSD